MFESKATLKRRLKEALAKIKSLEEELRIETEARRELGNSLLEHQAHAGKWERDRLYEAQQEIGKLKAQLSKQESWAEFIIKTLKELMDDADKKSSFNRAAAKVVRQLDL